MILKFRIQMRSEIICRNSMENNKCSMAKGPRMFSDRPVIPAILISTIIATLLCHRNSAGYHVRWNKREQTRGIDEIIRRTSMRSSNRD
jgi:hypothetical protein